jgi:hypothetical protein
VKVTNRDNQRNRVYTWEKNNSIMSSFWNNSFKAPTLNMTQEAVKALCVQILRDAGRIQQSQRFSVDFRQRNGGAEAHMYKASFTPSNIPKILVLHEMAHALTWMQTDFSGHGPNYVSCYLALLEKYLGLNIIDLARTLQTYVKKEVFTKVYVPYTFFDEKTQQYRVARRTVFEKKVKNVRPPEYDAAALKQWREVFK